MTKAELYQRLKEADKEVEDHIKIHHQGDSAGVLKLMNCQQYKDLMTESWTIRNMLANKRYDDA